MNDKAKCFQLIKDHNMNVAKGRVSIGGGDTQPLNLEGIQTAIRAANTLVLTCIEVAKDTLTIAPYAEDKLELKVTESAASCIVYLNKDTGKELYDLLGEFIQ